MWKSRPAEIAKTVIVLVFAIAVLAISQGCASVPKPKPVDAAPQPTKILSIIRITACGKALSYVVVTEDGAVNAAGAEELSKDEIDGLDEAANELPEGNAGNLQIPCVPMQKTGL